jgi:mitochondrial fission protein ELM1
MTAFPRHEILPGALPAPPSSWILSEPYAGLMAQAQGLAHAAALVPEARILTAPAPWRFVTARIWPAPLAIVGEAISGPVPDIVIGCGGVGAVVAAALRRRHGISAVQIQHPRMDPRRFDVVLVSTHDDLTGPNVIVTRTALHGASPARLAQAAALWRPALTHLPRPLVAVLVGGANGRFQFGAPDAAALGAQLAALAASGAGIALTPSRRTSPAAHAALARALGPAQAAGQAYFWDGTGDNPYFGLLALADVIIATEDSVSMMSEAAATTAPLLIARLPGHSRRIRGFSEGLIAAGRARNFIGRLETWPVTPIDDTEAAAFELRRRLGY